MCGIIGASGNIDEKKFKQSNEIISHRGPDDSGIFINKINKIALGHNRLSIIDVSSMGNQPMFDETKRFGIIYNGEIYNFLDIKNKLINKGIKFFSETDTEVLLKYYILEGEQILSKLNGIFSFAIWDNHNKSLFIARDGFGVKPLYYSESNETFIFGSELKALTQLLNNLIIDTEALVQYLTFLWSPGIKTPVKNIKKLEPGHALVVKSGLIIKKWCWYKIPLLQDKTKRLNFNKTKFKMINKLRKAVHRQMISDVPVGAFLSGGLDSSAIVAFAKEINPKIECFTIENNSLNEGFSDDLPYAKKVAKHLNLPLNIVKISSDHIINNIESMVYQLDEPLADPAALNVLYICQLAKENGIKVLLSGSGGDDLLTGYRRHLAIKYDYIFDLFPKSLFNLAEKLINNLNQNNPKIRRISKLLSGSKLHKNERLLNYFRWAAKDTISNLFTNSVKNQIINFDPMNYMNNYISKIPNHRYQIEKALALEQRFFLTEHNLNYTDKMSMAHGVEVRVPFLDLEFVKFSEKIPHSFLIKRNITKWILKKSMEGFLPTDVIYRSKTGFGVPLRKWIKEELKEYIYDITSEESLKKRGLFCHKKVRQLIKDNIEGKIDATYTIFSVVCIEIWLNKFYK